MSPRLLPLLIQLCLPGCRDGQHREDPKPDTADTGYELEPDFPYDRYCGEADPADTEVEATAGELGGGYLGYIQELPAGTLETMKIIPEHPFRVTSLRLALGGGSGTSRLRLMTTFGRSYPGGWPDIDSEGVNLMPPLELTFEEAPSARTWMEVDLSEHEVLLEPTQHYMIVHEYLEAGGPAAAVESLADGESSRAMIHVPGDEMPYGLDGNFRMELLGMNFCAWEEPERWFGLAPDMPFADDPCPYAAIVDLDSDGHQDLVLTGSGPRVYMGDGAGNFAAPEDDPFQEVAGVSLLVFGDVDNDGFVDAFAGWYVGADSDGDDVTVQEGDCNDVDSSVKPGATEILGDLKDNDCDGVADEGLDEMDHDGDGFSIAMGDCDDNRADVYPGAEEILDGRDNDCDLVVDQEFGNRILLNDGTGRFSILDDAGVESLDPTTAAAFGDGDMDGNLDIYWGNWLERYPYDPAVADMYFTGRGDGTFLDSAEAAGVVLDTPLSCYGVLWNDWNDDGAPDIFVGNYHLYDNQLWANQGDGTFVDMAPEVGVDHDDVPSPYSRYPGGHTYGGDFGDIDNDGDMDFYMANLAHPRVQPWSDPSMFLVNQGAPDYLMVNSLEDYGFIYDEGDVNAMFADYDNDMDLDLAVASLYSGHYSRLYRNDGGTWFTDVTYETGTAVEDAVSVVWADVDEDGDLDLLVADRGGAPYVHLFLNRVGQDRNWVQLELEGTTTNRDAIGARVTLTAGGVTQIREVSGGGGHHIQRPKTVHFGLADVTSVDEVTVRWVGGATETISGVTPNGRFKVVEGSLRAEPLPMSRGR